MSQPMWGAQESDVELLQKSITHFVEVNVNFRASELSSLETWENWDALLAQLSEMGIDADEEVEQLAFQSMQRAGVDLDFDEDDPTNAQDYESLESIEFHSIESEELDDNVSQRSSVLESAAEDSFEDLSDISEIQDFEDDIPPPIENVMSDDGEDIELISEEFIEEEYLTDADGEAFLLIVPPLPPRVPPAPRAARGGRHQGPRGV